MSGLPDPVTRDQQFLRGVCDRVDVLTELVRQLLTRLPDPPAQPDGRVELREPGRTQVAAEPAEDDAPASPEVDVAPESRPAARRRKTTKTKEA